ncbi:MAG: hypothetical protein JO198_03090 [Candidatus Dormibacteraeota bacterium]|nr:hypothetical protein [Candidatus Dormibacteraeota bacterium]
MTVRRWFTLFFIPIVPYQSSHLLLCSVCGRGAGVGGTGLAQARRMNQLALQYTSGAISEHEYQQLLPNVSGDALPAHAAPEVAVPSAAVASQSGPPREVPAFHAGRSGRATLIRIGVGLAALTAAIVLFTVTRAGGSNATAFMAGNCISGTQTSTSISPAACTGTHDARIDMVLVDPSRACPTTDLRFVPDSPSEPTLCLDYTDHNP